MATIAVVMAGLGGLVVAFVATIRLLVVRGFYDAIVTSGWL